MYIPDRQKAASLIVDGMGEDHDEQDEDLEGGDDDLESFAHDLIQAVKSGDARSVVSAMQALFAAFESGPHDEGEE